MNQPPNYRTPTRVKLLILAAAFGGLTLQVIQVVLFFTLANDLPSPFEMFDKVEVTYVNETSSVVVVYLDGEPQQVLAPITEGTNSYRKIEWWFGLRIEARDSAGRVVFASKLDKDDLEKQNYLVLIRGP